MDSTPLHVSQNSMLPPAQPAYVFRGHSAQIHAVHFFRENLRLLSGDADGWLVCWSIPIKRPVLVWKPHNGTILGLGSWGADKIITHGRDNKLFVWQLRLEEESEFSTILPTDDTITERKQPWLLHSLTINALNFCSFAMCLAPDVQGATGTTGDCASIIVATPGVQDGWVNVTSLPSEERLATIPNPTNAQTGMIMAIGVCYESGHLTVLAGYESGHTAVWQQGFPLEHWQVKYMNKSHTQPILSLDIAPGQRSYFTSSVDAIIARHSLPGHDSPPSQISQTKHAGQQSLTVRPDGKILATAGWDGRVRVYSPKSMKELAVLKWHKDGCYALDFAKIIDSTAEHNNAVESADSVIKRDLTVAEQRTEKATSTHWLAAGSKDGKVSLWDIY